MSSAAHRSLVSIVTLACCLCVSPPFAIHAQAPAATVTPRAPSQADYADLEEFRLPWDGDSSPTLYLTDDWVDHWSRGVTTPGMQWDFAGNDATVLSPSAGYVQLAESITGPYGTYVDVQTQDAGTTGGWSVRLAHMVRGSSIDPDYSDVWIPQGVPLGEMGGTGTACDTDPVTGLCRAAPTYSDNAYGTHLHMELFWAGGRPPATGSGTLRNWDLRFPEAGTPFGVDQAQLANEASSGVLRSANQTTYRPVISVRDAADVLPWHPERNVSGGPPALVYITTEQWSSLHGYRVTVRSVDTLDEVLDTGWVTVTSATWYALPAPSGTDGLWHGLKRGEYRWSAQALFPDIRQNYPDRHYFSTPVTGTFRILDQRNLLDRVEWFISSLVRRAHAAPPAGEQRLMPPPALPSPEEMGLEFRVGELVQLPATPQPELTPTPVISIDPTLVPATPGFTELLVSMDRDGQQDIALLSVADGAITWLTDDPAGDGQPAWSPDGQQIVFFSERDSDAPGLMGIYLMSRDGGNQRLLPDSEGASGHVRAAWSPDGTRIGYVRPSSLVRSGGDEVCIHPVVGGQVMCYSPGGLVRGELTWSPDGTRLAALGLFGEDPMIMDRPREIILVLDNSSSLGSPWLTRLEAPLGPLCPLWSPAEDRLAYTAYASPGWSVFVSGLDGTDPREVGRVPETQNCEYMKAWSPDGGWIAHSLSEGTYEHSGLAIGTADGLQHRTLLDATDWVRDIVWSADGTEIAYVWLESWETSGAVGREGAQRLEIIRLADLSRTVVLDSLVTSVAPPPLQRSPQGHR